MRSIQSQAMPVVQALWRHRWLAVGTAWLVCTAGWIGAAFVPTKYESSARVYLNADPLLDQALERVKAAGIMPHGAAVFGPLPGYRRRPRRVHRSPLRW